MAKNRKKKGPKPSPGIVQKTWKDKWRRVIRVMMLAVAVLLVIVALIIPVANNAVALGVEKELKALPLPEDTRLVESSSVAGRLTGNGNGMQYFGALLIESRLLAQELQKYYDSFSTEYLLSGYRVVPYTSQDAAQDAVVKQLPLTQKEGGDGYYVVYYEDTADHPLKDWLDLDMRGR